MSKPAPQEVYQTVRFGRDFTYMLGQLTPDASYTVRLHFAENSWTSPGQRVFNVDINGSQVLTNFDIFSAADGKGKAVVEPFTVTADANGQISIQFKAATDNAEVSGIELEDASGKVVDTIDAGLLSGGAIAVNPTHFTNEGSISVSNSEAFDVSGFSGELGTATLTGASTLTLAGAGYTVNDGLTAPAGSTLTLDGSWTNAAGSTISADGATLSLGDPGSSTNAWSNAGTIATANSTISLGGSFTTAGLNVASFNNASSTIHVVGTLDNSDATLPLGAVSGWWMLDGGTLKGGVITGANGSSIVGARNGGTLDGVTLDANLDLAQNDGANVNVVDGLTLNNATVFIGNAAGSTSGAIRFNNTETLGGTGTVVFGKGGNNQFDATSGADTLTLGSNITVRGSSGTIGGTGTIVNQGAINADDSGGGSWSYDNGFNTGFLG